MRKITLDNIPEDLHHLLELRAKQAQTSVEEQVLFLLRSALGKERSFGQALEAFRASFATEFTDEDAELLEAVRTRESVRAREA